MTSDRAPETYVCAVCGATAPAAMTAECNWCDRRYHLNQRSDVEAKDCGEVWVDEQYLALQFACNDCLAAEGAPKPAATAPVKHRKPLRLPVQRPRRYKRRE